MLEQGHTLNEKDEVVLHFKPEMNVDARAAKFYRYVLRKDPASAQPVRHQICLSPG